MEQNKIKEIAFNNLERFGFKKRKDDIYVFENEYCYICNDRTVVLKEKDKAKGFFELAYNDLIEPIRITTYIGKYNEQKQYVLKEENNKTIEELINYIGELEDSIHDLIKKNIKKTYLD